MIGNDWDIVLSDCINSEEFKILIKEYHLLSSLANL